MAIKSALNPESIVTKNRVSSTGAVNFLSGGTPLGTGIVSGAANKIVGFQKGGATATVAPQAPDLGSIIQTLSSNILTNVENKFSSANQSIQQFITNQFSDQYKNYESKIKTVDEDVPNKFLQNFIGLYKNAIGYIQFLGNRKNVKRLGDNLGILQRVFSESFEIAKILRTTIVKIVKQLSNLPKASPGGASGLNLDVKVPGGPLRKARPGRGGILKMLGKAGLVAGGLALGGAAVNAMSNSPSQSGVVQQSTTGTIPVPLLDTFSLILQRFERALDGFRAPSESAAPSAPSGPAGPRQTESQSSGAPGGGSTGVKAEDILADTPAKKALIATVREAEGTAGPGGYNTVYGGAVVPELTDMTLGELYEAQKIGGTDRLPERLGGGVIPYKKDKHNSSASGAVQIMPNTLKGLMDSGQFTPDQKFSPETQNAIILALGRQRIGGPITEESVVNNMGKLGQEWAGLTPFYSQTSTTEAQSIQSFRENLREARQGTSPTSSSTPMPPVVRSDTQIPQAMNMAATTVAQPPISKQQSNVSIIPMNLGSSKSNMQGGSLPAQMGSSGAGQIPMLSASNDDNFFTLYSKIVYNIVDG